MYTINFKFEQKEMAPLTLKKVEAGHSLLELALKNHIELPHDCGGVCACTACHLYVEKGMEFIDEQNKREKDFIHRLLHPRLNSRLGCQALLMEGSGEINVTVPDRSQFSRT